jgi:hypothetical protein
VGVWDYDLLCGANFERFLPWWDALFRLGGIVTVVFTLVVGIGIGFYFCAQESALMIGR